MRFQFEYLNRANRGVKIEFDQDNLSIGRSDENDFTLDNAFVSGVHARIFTSGNRLMIEDLGSTNGTFVNNQRLKAPAALRPGDVIQLGTEIKLRYSPLTSDFEDRTMIGTPEDLPDYEIPKPQPPMPARPSMPAETPPPPKKKRFPIWVIFVVGGVLILCVGAVLLGGGGAFLMSWLNLSGPGTDPAGEVAIQQTQFAMEQTQAAMGGGSASASTAAPPEAQPPEQQPVTPTLNLQATETAQAESTIWAASNATGTAQAEGTAAAIAQLWQYIQGNMIPEMLIYGPGSGTITLEDNDGVQGIVSGVSIANGVVMVDFYPPYSRDEAEWDVGIFFRDLGKNDEYRAIISSDGTFKLGDRLGEDTNYLVNIYIDNINLAPNQANRMVLLINGNKGACFVNGLFIAEFDLSSRMQPGDIVVVSHVATDYVVAGAQVQYENFKVYQLVQ